MLAYTIGLQVPLLGDSIRDRPRVLNHSNVYQICVREMGG